MRSVHPNNDPARPADPAQPADPAPPLNRAPDYQGPLAEDSEHFPAEAARYLDGMNRQNDPPAQVPEDRGPQQMGEGMEEEEDFELLLTARDYWAAIRTHHRTGRPVQDLYNFRLV